MHPAPAIPLAHVAIFAELAKMRSSSLLLLAIILNATIPQL
jgi:hypothetical protein